ncbi:prolipoprotein diacylglyceryl transferase [Chachezhania sediminis]|uniref:prolipoprotein diacylglyceryl transferase n=1 Tax=Chachezhania sediminis TaxID=2599291 RepID=UPI00131BF1AF|nr:prolipoprotein diacylglyceryl transferase [Chachezhania sediminis]
MQAVLTFPDISPEVFSFTLFGMDFALRWYALSYIAGIVVAWRLCVMALNRPRLWPGETPPMTARQFEDMLTWVILGVILGGRLGFVLFYQPAYYLANPVEILKIWHGGMSFHGGFIGTIVAVFLFARKQGISFASVADLCTHATPPGLFFGRMANFVNAELWGRPSEVPWAVIFPGEAAQFCPDVVGVCARHPSQLYEALLEGVLLGAVLLWLVYRRGAFRMPFFVSGAFLAGYGVARFFVEFFRQPDAQFVSPGNPLGLAFHVEGWGVTMGQTLSTPMILIGVAAMLVSWSRRPKTA